MKELSKLWQLVRGTLDRVVLLFKKHSAVNALYLWWAEEALRDIIERCEHAGTDAKCRYEVAGLAKCYWAAKSKHKKQNPKLTLDAPSASVRSEEAP